MSPDRPHVAEIANVRSALAERGNPWQAAETRMSRLPEDWRAARLDVPAPTDDEIAERAGQPEAMAAAARGAVGQSVSAMGARRARRCPLRSTCATSVAALMSPASVTRADVVHAWRSGRSRRSRARRRTRVVRRGFRRTCPRRTWMEAPLAGVGARAQPTCACSRPSRRIATCPWTTTRTPRARSTSSWCDHGKGR